MVDYYFPVVEQISDELEELEAEIFVDARQEQLHSILAMRRRLSVREQHLMRLLSDVQEHSYTEIARALDVPIGSIGPTRARCIAKLRPLLAG